MTYTRLAIMQGRLTPPSMDRIQSFPVAGWQAEFGAAATLGLAAIELIYEKQGLSDNPLATTSGCALLSDILAKTGTNVRSVCFDRLLEDPIVKLGAVEQNRLLEEVVSVSERASVLGVSRAVLPFVDASRIVDERDWNVASEWITTCAEELRALSIEIHLETDLAPEFFAEFLQEFDPTSVFVNYDTGNSASLGYSVDSEFDAYGQSIGSVHIKDRVRGGGSVPLGHGDAQISRCLERLAGISYSGDFVLQLARGVVGDEVAWVDTQISSVRNLAIEAGISL